jgi:hypothetical protein
MTPTVVGKGKPFPAPSLNGESRRGGKTSDRGHVMEREMNTPRPGPWANRVYDGGLVP